MPLLFKCYYQVLHTLGGLAQSHDKLVRDETNALLAKKKKLDRTEVAHNLDVIVEDFAQLLRSQMQVISSIDSKQLTSVKQALIQFWPKNTEPVKLESVKNEPIKGIKSMLKRGSFKKVTKHIMKKTRHDKCSALQAHFQRSADTLITTSVPAIALVLGTRKYGGGEDVDPATMDTCKGDIKLIESVCQHIQE